MPQSDKYTTEHVLALLKKNSEYRDDTTDRNDFANVTLEFYDEWLDAITRKQRQKEYHKFFRRLCELYEIDYSKDDWQCLAKDDTPMIYIAEHIGNVAKRYSIEPVKILNSRCIKAGIFYDIRRYMAFLTKSDSGFAPSSSINSTISINHQNHLATRLRSLIPTTANTTDLWDQSLIRSLGAILLACLLFFGPTGVTLIGIGIFANNAAESLPQILTFLQIPLYCLSGVACVLGGVAAILFVALLPCSIVGGVVSAIANRGKGPFAKNIKTFRDLVDRIAEPHCESCGYNLTGLARNRCPECNHTIDSPLLDLKDLLPPNLSTT